MIVVHPHGARVATLRGHVLLLEAGVPQEIPDALALEAFSVGAVQVVSEGEKPVDKAALAPPATTTLTDAERLTNVFVDILTRNVKEELRQDKQPRNATIQAHFGRAITEDERNAAYEAAVKRLPAA